MDLQGNGKEEADEPALEHALVERLDVLDDDHVGRMQPLHHVLEQPQAEERVTADEAKARERVELGVAESGEKRIEIVEELAGAEDCRGRVIGKGRKGNGSAPI